MSGFAIGDLALTPDDDLVQVVHFPRDGTIAVESPWSSQWVRYTPEQLRRSFTVRPSSDPSP